MSCCKDETGLPVVYGNYHKLQFYNSDFLSAVDKTRIGSDRIGSDRIGSDRTDKIWIGSNSIKETHIYSLKVGTFQIPIKNGQVVSLDQDDEGRPGFFRFHSVVDLPFIGIHLNYFINDNFFL